MWFRQGPDIAGLIISRRLKWVGHVRCRNIDKTIKRVWEGRPYGMRPLRRPRMLWNDQMKRGPRKPRADVEMAENRADWKRPVGSSWSEWLLQPIYYTFSLISSPHLPNKLWSRRYCNADSSSRIPSFSSSCTVHNYQTTDFSTHFFCWKVANFTWVTPRGDSNSYKIAHLFR